MNLDTLTERAFVKLLQDLEHKKDYHVILHCELERLNSILNLVGPPLCRHHTLTVVKMMVMMKRVFRMVMVMMRMVTMTIGMLIMTFFSDR